MLGIFTKIKLALAALAAGGIAILAFLFSREKSKNEALTEDNRVLEQNIETQAEVNQDNLDIKDFEIKREKQEAVIEERENSHLDSDLIKVEETPDGETFKVDL